MSSPANLTTPPLSREEAVPPLLQGDRLSLAEFERRYAARPEIKKAEFIEGVVYVPSPVSIHHAKIHNLIMGWTVVYQAATPGVFAADNGTLRLDWENEVQPDGMMWTSGSHVHTTPENYMAGAPELVIEVATTSANYDLHDKRRVYQRSGIQEYLVLLTYNQQTIWHTLVNGRYQPLPPDEDGIYRSRVFPGLWLDAKQFWAENAAGMLAVLQEGLKSQDHAAFAETLSQNS